MTEENRLLVVGGNDDDEQQPVLPERSTKEREINLPPINIYYDDLVYIYKQLVRFARNNDELKIKTDEFQFQTPQDLRQWYSRGRRLREIAILPWRSQLSIRLNENSAFMTYDLHNDDEFAVAKLIEERLKQRARLVPRIVRIFHYSLIIYIVSVFLLIFIMPVRGPAIHWLTTGAVGAFVLVLLCQPLKEWLHNKRHVLFHLIESHQAPTFAERYGERMWSIGTHLVAVVVGALVTWLLTG
jgi:hypothetical protein